jgi:type II secretory pathway pseudopilin PulG
LVVVVGVLAVVALLLAVTLIRSRARTERALGDARAETAALRAQLEALEQRLSAPAPAAAQAEYVITDLGNAEADRPPAPTPQIGGAVFADLVLRETVVKAASLAHGVRRALDAETRNRIRFEMKREVKRARKQRRADTRQARREWEARQRAATDEEGTAA